MFVTAKIFRPKLEGCKLIYLGMRLTLKLKCLVVTNTLAYSRVPVEFSSVELECQNLYVDGVCVWGGGGVGLCGCVWVGGWEPTSTHSGMNLTKV